MSGTKVSEKMEDLFQQLPGIEEPLELESEIVDLQFSISMLEEKISKRRAENAMALTTIEEAQNLEKKILQHETSALTNPEIEAENLKSQVRDLRSL